jgi:uncharacterized protein YbaR (Trm112 family)
MFIEHIDLLRCTASHEQSWLVAAFTKRDDRFVVEAKLGCPICYRQYPVIDGVAYFGNLPVVDHQQIVADMGTAEDALRVAAFLNVSERSTLVLAGEWGKDAHALAEIVPMTAFVLGGGPVRDSVHVAYVESLEGIPLADGSVHGVALDNMTATPRNVTTAVHVLRPGGRLVAPVGVDVPDGVSVLALDEIYWVGEKGGDVVRLRRA